MSKGLILTASKKLVCSEIIMIVLLDAKRGRMRKEGMKRFKQVENQFGLAKVVLNVNSYRTMIYMFFFVI